MTDQIKRHGSPVTFSRCTITTAKERIHAHLTQVKPPPEKKTEGQSRRTVHTYKV
jgi:hypothetical protein